jgi:hypothetical protein
MEEENSDSSPRGQGLQINDTSQAFSSQLQLVLDELRTQRQEFQVLRDEVQGNSRSVSSEVNKLKSEKNLSWKFEGHKIQYELNSSIDEKAKQAKWGIENGKYQYACELLEEIINLIKERNKHIRIADTSAGGWDTVRNYVSNPIASDDEDEAKISKAENKALKRKKEKQAGKIPNAKRSGTTRFSPMDFNVPVRNTPGVYGTPERSATTGFGRGNLFRPYFGGPRYNSTSGSYGTAAPGPCFACGEFSHFRRDCPYTFGQPGNQPASKK